ncbi:hypothetical protein JTB14_027969 [Gonioctena quinquepunctata]|nr:hypothetical protein JTB14_027969 [Gonioctena quinquepunctata]
MSCMCLPGYVGDADTECKPAPEKEPGCSDNRECPSTDACLNRKCVNPCAVGNPCALTGECKSTDHKAICSCPPGLIGDPFIKCYQQTLIKPECTVDSECSSDKSCVNQRCQDPCSLANPCGANAECRTNFHRPTCICPDGWLGNPQVSCYKPECKSDNDCPYDKSCINENCLNPCVAQNCGRGAECIVQNHHAQCRCPLGTQGDPFLACITGICHYNEDCADHEACDRLNRVCRPVCDDETCADTATCIGQQHQPKCHCPTGTTGNPYIECTVPTIPVPDVECRSDIECSSQLACIITTARIHAHRKCLLPDQECRV